MKKAPFVQGVSFIPDKLDCQNPGEMIWRVEAELVDFLYCIKDLLDIIHLIKPRHLRSTLPMPHEVLRDLRYHKGKGSVFRCYEKNVLGYCAGVSASVDFVLGVETKPPSNKFRTFGMSTFSDTTGGGKRPAMKTRRPLAGHLIGIIGKKTKPKWHQVLLEKPVEPEVVKDSERTEPKKKRKSSQKPFKYDLKPRTKKRDFSIQFATSAKPLPVESPKYQQQLQMMIASAAGFSTVEKHERHLLTLKPHWYTDLVKNAADVGLINSEEVAQGFIALGKHCNMTCSSLPLAKSKLCYVVMSLPIWDIGRLTMQRAVEFILRHILLLKDGDSDLQDWLSSRNLAYVIMPPIQEQDLYGNGAHPENSEAEDGEDTEPDSEVKIVENKE